MFDMMRHVLMTLAFLNQAPYVTSAQCVSQARGFALKPQGFDALADIVVEGTYQDLPRLRKVAVAVFTQLETTLEELGFHLYDDNLDPNLPMRKFA
ncbi:MAG TPA: hypothetical protein VNO70_26020 [Blastocatellia bacterium]|nr:hypothetical protein [Blastocatellia bacterium]